MRKILDVKDAARLKHVAPITVYRWIYGGLLTPIKGGGHHLFFRRGDVIAMMLPKKGRPPKKGGEPCGN